jgi:glycosyltransferase involved in cell wall biosynthesis
MRVAVFHPGTQHSWQTALALQQDNRLAWYATSIFYQPDRFPYRLERMVPAPVARRLHAEFRRFSHPSLDPALVRTSGAVEWIERIAARAGWRGVARWLDKRGNEGFVHTIGREIASTAPFALWGYSGSSRTSFEMGRQQGRTLILDRTNGDFREYNDRMAMLQESYGEWFLPTDRRVPDAQIENDQREYELADRILVGSNFAAETVRQRGGPAVAPKVQVLPYCFDETLFAGAPIPTPVAPDRPVKLLFVGHVNARKGIHHLLEAIERIPASQASLTIVGELRVPRAVFARYADRITYIPTVPRADIPRIMADHHALIFPSYFEGSALSLLEGLASGLALVQTPSSGNGVTPDSGIMLERPDSELLQDALVQLISDRDRLQEWRINAQQEAKRYTFGRYRQNIVAMLDALPTA